VKGATVAQVERHGRVAALLIGQIPGVDQQCAGESRLHQQTVARRKLDDDEFRTSPAVADHSPGQATRQLVGSDLAEHIWARDADGDDSLPRKLAIEVASDRLSLG
jgi:hypothetical protein